MLSQLRAHQFPVWVEQLDVGEALDQLRICGAVGFAGQKDAWIEMRNSSFSFSLRGKKHRLVILCEWIFLGGGENDIMMGPLGGYFVAGNYPIDSPPLGGEQIRA